MALTREQYDEIMRILSSRRAEALSSQQRRQEEVEHRLPAVRIYNDRISGLLGQEIRARLQQDRGKAEELSVLRHRLQEEKRRLLEEAGVDPDYMQPVYTCPYCKDTGYVGREKCSCMRQLESLILNRDAALPDLLDKENFSTFDIAVFDDTKPLKELLPGRRDTQRGYMKSDILPAIRRCLQRYDNKETVNILMIGPPGTGKTFLLNCMAKAMIDRQRAVIYERADHLFSLMSRENFAREKDEAAQEHIARAGSCETLILDDLGTEFVTEYTRSALFSLISNRLSLGLSTIISSNLSLNQIKQIYGERISSRLWGEYLLLPFYGGDLRKRRG